MELKKIILMNFLIVFCLSNYFFFKESFIIQTNETTVDNYYKSFLSPSGNHLMVVTFNQTTNLFKQTAYDFNGTKVC